MFLYWNLFPPRHPPSGWLRLFFEPNLPHINKPKILNPSYTSYLLAYEDVTDTVFRNVGTRTTDAGESPSRKHTTTTVLFVIEALEKRSVVRAQRWGGN
jgi:hypothetical protein